VIGQQRLLEALGAGGLVGDERKRSPERQTHSGVAPATARAPLRRTSDSWWPT
jgi:hypothetical protein